jgi:hypothetical protein
VHGDVIRLIALDFILRLIPAGVARVALVVRIFGMDFDNPAADVSGFGIPDDVIALFEAFCHLAFNAQACRRFNSPAAQLPITVGKLLRPAGLPLFFIASS